MAFELLVFSVGATAIFVLYVCYWTVLVLLLFICVLLNFFFLVAFITPLIYTAYLGQLPAVRFHCSVANASSVAWSINGDIRLLDWLEDRGIETVTGPNSLESTLILSSRIVNNNTRILCLARHFGSFAYKESVEATFQVQGRLASIATDHKLWMCDICHALFCRCTGKMP